MAGLTTHVLDTVQGRPAAGVEIELFELSPDGTRDRIAHTLTNVPGLPEHQAEILRFGQWLEAPAAQTVKGALRVADTRSVRSTEP